MTVCADRSRPSDEKSESENKHTKALWAVESNTDGQRKQ